MILYNGTKSVRLTIEDRRYAVCAEKCYDVDGTDLHTFCGALIDITDMPQIREASLTCGIESNHRSTYNERTA